MTKPRKADSALRGFRPLVLLIAILAAAAAGIAWYASTEPPLDWTAGEPPRLLDELGDMIRTRTAAVSIDEAELNAMLKPELYALRRLSDNAVITGADFSLDGDTLVMRTDITLWNRLRLPVAHTVKLRWDEPDIVAEHVSSSLKAIPLPKSLFPIGTIRVPLRLGEQLRIVEVDRVEFADDAIRIHLRARLPFP